MFEHIAWSNQHAQEVMIVEPKRLRTPDDSFYILFAEDDWFWIHIFQPHENTINEIEQAPQKHAKAEPHFVMLGQHVASTAEGVSKAPQRRNPHARGR